MRYVRELQVKYVKKRIPNNTITDVPVNDPESAASLFVHLIGNEPIEKMVALFLDTRHCVLAYRVIAMGCVNSAPVFLGEVAKAGLLANATGIIVAHNHPSGNLDPSLQDLALAQKMKKALALVDLALLDFLIVNDEKHFSLLHQ